MVDLNKQKSLFFMELFLYLIFLDLDKMDIYRDKPVPCDCGRGGVVSPFTHSPGFLLDLARKTIH